MNILYKDDFLIILKLAEGFNIIILGLIYWRPGKMYDLYLDTLTEIIEDLSGEYGEYPVILGGDFNSRIGHSNQLSSEVTENSCLLSYRDSLDSIFNKRGKKLVEMMEESGMIVFNGRSPSDFPAQFTFISQQGRSTIDLVWGNISSLDICVDLSVNNNIFPFLNHLSCLLKLSLPGLRPQQQPTETNFIVNTSITKYKWSNILKNGYHLSMNENRNLYYNSNNPEDLYQNLNYAISNSAKYLNMVNLTRCTHVSNFKQSRNDWFDAECSNAKRIVNKKYKEWKKNGSENVFLEFIDLRKKYCNLLC